ncbi:hypothetical protein [Spirosoma aerophilum]
MKPCVIKESLPDFCCLIVYPKCQINQWLAHFFAELPIDMQVAD